MTILKGLLAWLAGQGYLAINPMMDLQRRALPEPPSSSVRRLSTAEWQAIRDHLDRQPADCTHERLRCLLALAAGAGLRLAELAAMRREHVQPPSTLDEHGAGSTLQWKDAGGKPREVALSPTVMAAVEAYFQRRGFADFATAPLDAPVLAALPVRPAIASQQTAGSLAAEDATATTGAEAPLSVERIHRLVKRLLADVADHWQAADPAMALRLRAASADWLRFSASEADFTSVRRSAGRTTTTASP